MSRVDDPPARGSRPRNRREITLRVASDLFYRRGYPAVSMSEIADEMNVGASAIYRHFRSKSELLAAVIHREIEPYRLAATAEAAQGADGSGDPATLVRRMSEAALDHRELGVLWQREGRNLSTDDMKSLREELGEVADALGRGLAVSRPDLDATQVDFLAWCALGTLVSVSFHSLSLTRGRFVDLLSALVGSVLEVSLPHDYVKDLTPGARAAATPSRRDVLISQASELFAERGFGAVGVDDIGVAAGIAGPTLYSHFSSKQKILAEAIRRGSDLLAADATAALSAGSTPRAALEKLVDSFIRLAVSQRFFVRIVLSELDQLDAEDRQFAVQVQRDYVSTWSRTLEQFRGLGSTTSRICVQAVLLVVNDAVQTPHLRELPQFEPWLRRVAHHMLGLDEEPG